MAVQRKDYLGVFLVAFVASAGGNYGSSFWRADKFTGTQGANVESLAIDNERRIKSLEDGLPPKWLTDWVERIETKADACDHYIKGLNK